MVHMEGEIVINRPVEMVFDFVVDARGITLRRYSIDQRGTDHMISRNFHYDSAFSVTLLDVSVSLSDLFKRIRPVDNGLYSSRFNELS